MTVTRLPGHVTGAGSVAGDVVGGFGIVRPVRVRGCRAIYRAQAHGRDVMVKTLCRDATAKAHRRFDNEVAALELLADVDCVPALVATGMDGPQRFLAMEWRGGAPLRRDRVPSVAEFAPVASAVVEAVRRVHAAGVVHGDLSRLNLLVDGAVVVPVDFESSRHAASPAAVSRRVTWVYAAPEVADGPPGVLSDQYSTAAVLYRYLAGRHCRPPRGEAAPDSVEALAKRARPLPSRVRRSGLAAVFETALAVDPGARFGSLGAFGDALRAALE